MSTTIALASPYGIRPDERAAAAHAEAARVVDDDQVGAAGLRQLRREAGAGAGADDRAAGGDLGAEPRECLLPSSCRSLDQLVEPVRHRERERGVVHVGVDLVHLDLRGVDRARGSCRRAPRRPRGRRRPGPRSRSPTRRAAGTKSSVGPVAALSFPAMMRPISRHSSGVVRISVIVGLWT